MHVTFDLYTLVGRCARRDQIQWSNKVNKFLSHTKQGILGESSPVNRRSCHMSSVLKQFVPGNKGCVVQEWNWETQSPFCAACNNLPRMWRPCAVASRELLFCFGFPFPFSISISISTKSSFPLKTMTAASLLGASLIHLSLVSMQKVQYILAVGALSCECVHDLN